MIWGFKKRLSAVVDDKTFFDFNYLALIRKVELLGLSFKLGQSNN